MRPQPADLYLGSYLAPLAVWLAEAGVTDIYINRPGELWIERAGAPPERREAPDLTHETLARLVRQIAAVSAQGISREHPLLAASLPGGERVQVVMPPATRGDIVIAIRKHVVTGLSLEEHGASGSFAETRMHSGEEAALRASRVEPDADAIALLRRAVRERRNILVSGGTSSGKTTFLNTLLREVPRDERLVVIEDTSELQLHHQNAVGLLAARGRSGEAEVSADDLLIAALRLRPDRIILGEIRGSEAVTFLRAVNTGHPGSLSSIHADTPLRAIDQLALLVMQTGTRMGWSDVETYIRRSLDIIVQLRHHAGARTVDTIHVVDR